MLFKSEDALIIGLFEEYPSFLSEKLRMGGSVIVLKALIFRSLVFSVIYLVILKKQAFFTTSFDPVTMRNFILLLFIRHQWCIASMRGHLKTVGSDLR